MPHDALFPSADQEWAGRRVLVATPHGFCAGVQRAVDAVEQALAHAGAPVFVRHAIVHNRQVVERLERLGAVFVEEIEEIPLGAVAILSAHGSARAVRTAAAKRNLKLIDAVCPLVSKVHAEIDEWHRAGRHILLVGHREHPEIIGSIGQLPAGAVTVIASVEELDQLEFPTTLPIAYAVQTTFSLRDAAGIIAAIKERFRNTAGPRSSDICYATTNRQEAIERIAPACDLTIVVGDEASSNANRLVEAALAAGSSLAILVPTAEQLPRRRIAGLSTIGLTAAASTPATTVEEVCNALRELGFSITTMPGTEERIRFRPIPLDGLERQ